MPAGDPRILYRAAERCQVALTLVANQTIEIPRSRHVRMLTVSAGFDVADNEIARRVEAGDLVVTSDIPLAADATPGTPVVSPRGEAFYPTISASA